MQVGRTEHPPGDSVTGVPFGLLLRALQAKLCVKDRAGTVVELLDPLVTDCCQKGLAPALLALSWDCWGK